MARQNIMVGAFDGGNSQESKKERDRKGPRFQGPSPVTKFLPLGSSS
jgi:hypothetical protein